MSYGIVKVMHKGMWKTPNKGILIDFQTGIEYSFTRPDEVAFGTVPAKWNVKVHDTVSFTLVNGVATNVTLYKAKREGYIHGSFPIFGPATYYAKGSVSGRTIIGGNCSGIEWTPEQELDGETPNFWYREGTRSGLTLPDSVNPGVGDETITLPHLGFETNGYAYVNDNGAMDIINNLGTNPLGNGDQGFTLCGWANNITAAKAGYKYLFGKPIAGSRVGRYGILANITDGYILAYLQSSGGYVNRVSTIDYTTLTWAFLLMDVNYTTKKMRLFVNNVQIGADVDFTGTLSALDNKYRFYINVCGADADGAPTLGGQANHYSDIRIFNKILTPTEQTTLYNKGHISKPVFNYPLATYIGTTTPDSGLNGKHLTFTNANYNYDAYGSRQLLDVGYTRHIDFPNKEFQVAYEDTNTPTSHVFAGYTKDSDVPGSPIEFNKAQSYVTITGIDRSDTTECSFLARQTILQNYYLAAGVSLLHGVELNNKDISNYFNDNYRGLNFVKESGGKVTDILRYATNKTGTDYETIIKWTAESILKFDVIVGDHICAVKGAKVLKFDDVHTLYLSNDNGVTYPISLVTTCNEIVDAFFYDNGNIGFSDHTKCYYSDDDLATYQESTVLGADGNPFVPGTLNNFRAWTRDENEAIVNGVHIRTWGTYVTGGTAEFNNVNVWYTIDGGVTIKSFYLYGAPNLLARHVQYIRYDAIGGVWYLMSGDGDGVNNYINFHSVTYNTTTDAWTLTLIKTSNDVNGMWQSSGIHFDDDYIYYVIEVNSARRGVSRILRSDVANIETNLELIYKEDDWCYGVNIDNYFSIFFSGRDANPKGWITFSNDKRRFFSRIFNQVPLNAALGGISYIGRMSNGYYVFMILETGENANNYTLGNCLLIKPSVIS